MEEAAVGMFLCLLGAVLFDMETQLSNQLSLQTLGTLSVMGQGFGEATLPSSDRT